ncbi:MAG: VWA domain-containing protein [Rhodospirillaceae bacterium]|nr:VWA domain-containing protein [Rhodospirillaceae bacterium]
MVARAGDEPGGKLLDNLMHFARTLRAAGLPVGPGSVIDAVRAVEAAGITKREDFYWTLHAVFVSRSDHRPLFDQAFHAFWRNPQILERMLSLLLPRLPREGEPPGEALSRRLSEALHPGQGENESEGEQRIEWEAALTYSDREVLQKMDFEDMSSDELARAKAAISRMRLAIADIPTRRFAPHSRGLRVDMRRSLRAVLRSGGAIIPLRRQRKRHRPPPLVILCDISGSMGRYSRMLLHFMHALTSDRDRVFSFLFGTRLTDITRLMRHRDVDKAVDAVVDAVDDWSGGTRIGTCLHDFNQVWARRVLSQGAVVLLVTDGLDRAGGEGLAEEMERLHKSCRRLIWLNPLLRYEGFEPKSLGVRAILPHVDAFRTVHNLESLEQLAAALARPGSGAEDLVRWKQAM